MFESKRGMDADARLACRTLGESGWSRNRVGVAAVCALLAGWVGLPSSGLASTTVGSSLTAPATAGVYCQSGCAYTWAITTLPAGSPPVTSPFTGTIVRWRIKTANGGGGTVRLRVVAPGGGARGTYTGAGTGASETTPATATTTTFSAQLPIQAGDYIGLNVSLDPGQSIIPRARPQTGAKTAEFSPPLADGVPKAPSTNFSNDELLVNADVAARPTSSVAISTCNSGGETLTATVTPDPDPAVAAKAIHFRLDGGPEQTVATSGNPGTAPIFVPSGSHTLEYWGEDSVGGLENPHHTASIVGCSVSPGPTTGTSPGAVAGPLPLPSAPFPPSVSALSESHTVFRVGAKSSPLLGRTTRSFPRGTTFSFRLNQPAVVAVRIQRKLPGRRVGRVCKAPSRLLRSRPRCTRLVTKATLRRTARVGLNKITFSGRIRGRALHPGRYRAAFVAANTAGASALRALNFIIVAG
jgi:hypothetical protein